MSQEEVDILIREYGVQASFMAAALLIIGIAAVTAIRRFCTKQLRKWRLGFLYDLGLGVPVSAAIITAESALFQTPISARTLAMLAAISGLCIALMISLAKTVKNGGFLSGNPDGKQIPKE